MTILVTGGAGYIGGHMVLKLLDMGEQVVVIDDMSNGVPWAIPPGVPFILGEVGDYETVAQTIARYNVDTVIHFAGRLISPAYYKTPLVYYQQNTVASRTLLQAVTDFGIKRFIFSATAAVYGNPKVNPVSEAAEIAPTGPYGSSKWMVEVMLRDTAEVSDLKYAALRYFNVAGADPKGRYGQSTTKTTLLVQIAVQSALGVRNGIDIYGSDYPTIDGTCVRDYLHVSDLIDAHVAALEHLRAGGDSLTVNCGYGHGYSVMQVVEMAKKVSGNDFDVRMAPRRRGDAIEVVSDPSLIHRTLQWRPQWDDLEKIVTHAYAWEQKMMDSYRFKNRA